MTHSSEASVDGTNLHRLTRRRFLPLFVAGAAALTLPEVVDAQSLIIIPEPKINISVRNLRFPGEQARAACAAGISRALEPYRQLLPGQSKGFTVELYKGTRISSHLSGSTIMVFCPPEAVAGNPDNITAAALNAGIKDWDRQLNYAPSSALSIKYQDLYGLSLEQELPANNGRLRELFRIPEYVKNPVVNTGNEVIDRQDFLANGLTILTNYYSGLDERLRDPAFDSKLKKKIADILLIGLSSVQNVRMLLYPDHPQPLAQVNIDPRSIRALQSLSGNRIAIIP